MARLARLIVPGNSWNSPIRVPGLLKPHQQAGHMIALDAAVVSAKKALAFQGASTQGRSSRTV